MLVVLNFDHTSELPESLYKHINIHGLGQTDGIRFSKGKKEVINLFLRTFQVIVMHMGD
jgi:hypothetical protein